MANQIKFAGTITPANTPCEGSHDGGATYRPVPITTVGAGQEGILTNVPTGPYAAGVVKFRAVGYPATMQSAGALTVAGPAAAYALSFEGDSLSAPLARNGFASCWPEQFQTLVAAPQYSGFLNYATGGDVIGDGTGATHMAATAQKSEVLAGKSATATNLLYLLAGINDLQTGQTAAAAFARVQGLVGYYQGQGYRVALFTTNTSRHPSSPPPAEFYTRVVALNNLIRDWFNAGNGPTVLVDSQTDARIGGYDAPLNTTYYVDGIHLTTAGNAIRAAFAQRALPFMTANTRRVINAANDAATATLEGIGWQDAVWATRAADFLDDTPAGTYRTSATGGSWGHGATTTATLAAGATGGFRLRFATAGGVAGVIGLHDAPGRVPVTDMNYAFYVEPGANPTISIFYRLSAGNPGITGPAATLGRYYRLWREAGQVTIQESTDGNSWATIYTYATGSTAALYPQVDINASAAFHLEYPQTLGAV